MTPKEAIEILTGDKKLDEIEHKGGIEGQKKVARLYNEAFDMAVEALENQIPKKPLDKTKGMEDYGYCPNCKKIIDEYKDFKFCSTCGQAIDWRDVE